MDFSGKARKKEITRRPRRRWKDIIKMDLRESGWDLWRALVNTLMNLQVP
jgi:hypothetical protein